MALINFRTCFRLVTGALSDADKKATLKIYKNLVLSRLFEEKIISLAQEGRIKKHWIFSGLGQEGGQASIVSVMKTDDWLIPSLRSYTSLIGKGYPLKLIAAEIFGKKDGASKGLGAPFTLHSEKYGLARRSDVVGVDCETAVGIALGLKQRKKSGIVVNFFGEGAATRGTVWSSLNISALWKLPVFWVCENNQYAVTTHISSLTVEPFFKKAESFGILSKKVNGNDPLEVYFQAKGMFEYIRRERKPAFLDLVTYRLMGHDLFYVTDQGYQNPKEMKKWRKRDPLRTLERQLLFAGIVNSEKAKKIKTAAISEIEQVILWAEKQEDITREELLKTSFL
jgi:TPP-dependent pyruvate/acetoin dehydrogenase alpha subunit